MSVLFWFKLLSKGPHVLKNCETWGRNGHISSALGIAAKMGLTLCVNDCSYHRP